MAGSRTLKLSILGDVDNLNKSLKSATKDVDTFGDKIGKTGKMIGAAFVAAAAAAGAYAVKIGIEGVKAAVEDEKAQTQLALALENATGATNAQIAATEQSILKMSLATGVADDQLRPALGRLVRSTGDITKAQDLLTNALDIATATGKPLETVANALGKAYDGNTAALGKLGIGLSAAELKTMNFTQVQSRLSDLFGGAAARNADTYAGRIARMQVAFDEAKETIGFALLPILEKVINFINQNALPAINAFSNAFSLDGGGLGGQITQVGNLLTAVFTPIINGLVKAFGYVRDAIGDNLETFKVFGAYIATYLAPVIGTVLGGALQVVGKIAGGVIDVIAGVVKILNGLISGAVAGINALISAYNSIPFLPNVSKISAPSVNVPTISVPKTSTPTIPSVPTIKLPSSSGSTGTSGGGIAAAAKAGAGVAAAVAGGGFTDSQNAARLAAAGGGGFTDSQNAARISITVNGAIDKEGTARTIVETLNNSYYRGTGGATSLQIA
jgi:phage-related protein